MIQVLFDKPTYVVLLLVVTGLYSEQFSHSWSGNQRQEELCPVHCVGVILNVSSMRARQRKEFPCNTLLCTVMATIITVYHKYRPSHIKQHLHGIGNRCNPNNRTPVVPLANNPPGTSFLSIKNIIVAGLYLTDAVGLQPTDSYTAYIASHRGWCHTI